MVTFEELSALALALPEATERPAYGMPCFRVRDKIFTVYRAEWHAAVCRVTPEDKLSLPQQEPDVFSVPHHYRNAPMVAVSLAAVDPVHLRELVTDAWRLRAPRALVTAWDSAE